MPTQVLDTTPSSIARAAECLRAGGLVAFPTETVYGLGVHALDAAAVRRAFAAKGRPANDPLIVHVASAPEVRALVARMPPQAEALAARFWPGPLTLVLPKSPRVPAEVTAGLDTVAIRLPAHPVARALLDAARIPIAAPSANLFSRPSPTHPRHVLHDLDDRIDLVLDGGPTPVGVESTVVDLTVEPPIVLRPGAITLEALREVVPNIRMRAETRGGDEEAPARSPGLLSRHYAPRAPLTLFRGAADAAVNALLARAEEAVRHGRSVGVLAMREDVDLFGGFPVRVIEIGSRGDMAGVAARLYSAMRDLDAAGVDLILACDVAPEGIGRAVRDRLARAAEELVEVP